MRNSLPATNSSDYQAAGKKVVAQLIKIYRGILFTVDPKQGSDWHYAGKNVAMGQPNTPILWYRPAGSDTYRVINADLTVREVSAENLPKIESVLLDSPTTQP